MPVFQSPIDPSDVPNGVETVTVVVSRILLQKKRWRTTAANGVDVAIDYENPASHGTCIGIEANIAYEIFQDKEEVIIIDIPDSKD